MQHETPTPPAVHWRSLPHYLVLGALRLLCYLPRRWALGAGLGRGLRKTVFYGATVS